ncbi:MAG: ABC transporter ATP-binding protein [Flavobacteriia bacterium]|nr:ABC transporter ATP-binding protein [Flavobacteriia bacterium]
MKGFWEIYRLSVFYKGQAFLIVFYNFLFVVFNLLSLVLFVPFLQIIFQDTKNKKIIENPEGLDLSFFDYVQQKYQYEMNALATNDPSKALLLVCLVVLMAFFFKSFFRYLAVYHHSFMKVAIVRDLRNQLFEKYLHLPMSYYTEEKKGDLLTRINNDLGEIEFASTSMLELIFREPIAILLSLATLIYWSPTLTLVSLILLPISAFIISIIGKSLKKTAKQGQEQLGLLVSFVEESLGGIRVIAAFGARIFVMNNFKKINLKHQLLLSKMYRKKDLSSPLNEFLGACVMIALVWFGGSMILSAKGNSSMSGEEFIAFIIVFSQLLRPIQGIATSFSTIQKASVSYTRFLEILNINKNETISKDNIPFDGLKRNIQFVDVSFKYKEDWVLKDFNLQFPKGKTIALVGESGAGKSTIADLILHFYSVNEGKILFDDIPIEQIRTKDLRREIAVVHQESILFNDTIRNNICFGMENCSEQSVIEAAKIAHAHDFIVQLEEGYDTNIGERGNKLSGGQKQRISIARAVLRNPSILLLDEATSSLDNESEKIVQGALDELMKNRTSIVIAHRLSTIINADLIVVLHQGKVIEIGTHSELLELKKHYFSLYESWKN